MFKFNANGIQQFKLSTDNEVQVMHHKFDPNTRRRMDLRKLVQTTVNIVRQDTDEMFNGNFGS